MLSAIKSRWTIWMGHVARMREKGNVYEMLVGMRSLESSGRSWEDSIKIVLNKYAAEYGMD